MRKILFVMLMSVAVMGCKKKESSSGSDKTSEGGAAAAADLPALTAEPDPGAITAAETPPFESVKFRMLAKRSKGGWPTFDAYNLGTKPIGFLAIYGYAYDKTGKQLARTKVPLSWNGKLEPGGKTDWTIDLSAGDTPVTADATTFQLCYSSIKFVGDENSTSEPARCPEQRPKQ
jgi:hypothetical protein